jgi:hypothetical protein
VRSDSLTIPAEEAPENMLPNQAPVPGPSRLRAFWIPAHHPYSRPIAEALWPTAVLLPSLDEPAPTYDELYSPAMVKLVSKLVDLLHVQFGFATLPVETLEAFLNAAAKEGSRLVFTAHDILCPQVHDQVTYGRKLDLLMGAADRVVTLTSKAALAIKDGWGRSADIIPHPHVFSISDISKSVPRRVQVVGIHLKSLRPGIDLQWALQCAEAIVTERPKLSVRIDLNIPHNAQSGPKAALERLDRHPRIMISRHLKFSDSELLKYFRHCSAVLLPYRTSTHSGWDRGSSERLRCDR